MKGTPVGSAHVSRGLVRAALLCLVILAFWPSPPASLAARTVPAVPPTIFPDASYTIEVSLDPETKMLTGHEVISYSNATGEPIPDLVFHLYLNAFRDQNSIFLRESGLGHRSHAWDPQHPGWIEVTSIRLADGTELALEELEDGSLARAALPAPVPRGEKVVIELDFQAQLPRVFARTGFVDDYFMVGQWFPKLGVWQNGAWNAYPFHANAEFYADFGTYDVSITLPADYITGATGMPVSVVDNGDGTQTVHYRAKRVIDFAWVASPRLKEALRQVGGLELRYLYLPEHAWTVERVLRAAESATGYYSAWYGPYPYPRLTIVDVPEDGEGAGGMEYPTLVTAGVLSVMGLGPGPIRVGSERSLELVVVHEIGHQWWQSMVATNEAEEPWLDEGLADYSALRVMEKVYGADASLLDVGAFDLGYLDIQRMSYLTNPSVPMYGRAWDFGSEYSIATYAKPVLALRTLERTLGDEMLLRILSTYFQRYQFAHPTTENLRAVAQEVVGYDLDWFFDGLVYGDGVLNYTVSTVDAHSVTVARQGKLVIPTEVLVRFADGSSVLEQWNGRDRQETFPYPGYPPVLNATVDPEHKLAIELRRSDNGLSRPVEVTAWMAVATRLLSNLQDVLLATGGL